MGFFFVSFVTTLVLCVLYSSCFLFVGLLCCTCRTAALQFLVPSRLDRILETSSMYSRKEMFQNCVAILWIAQFYKLMLGDLRKLKLKCEMHQVFQDTFAFFLPCCRLMEKLCKIFTSGAIVGEEDIVYQTIHAQ